MYKDMLRFAWRVFRILEAAHQAQGIKAQTTPPETVSSQGGTHIMKGKKLIALVLCLLLTISLLPVSALAEGDGEEPAQPVDTTPPTAETDPGEAPQGDAKDNETTPPADDGDATTPPAGTGEEPDNTTADEPGDTTGGEPADDPADTPKDLLALRGTADAEPASVDTTENITVYFTDAQNWGAVNVYYWNDGPDWPGTPMEAHETNDYCQIVYKASIPADVSGIIFNGNGNQTVDITSNIANGAQWYTTGEKEDAKYKVNLVVVQQATLTLAANNGTDEKTSFQYAVNTEVTIPACSFTYEGHSFTGWNTDADGLGTAYASNETTTLTANLTLYAQWTDSCPHEFPEIIESWADEPFSYTPIEGDATYHNTTGIMRRWYSCPNCSATWEEYVPYTCREYHNFHDGYCEQCLYEHPLKINSLTVSCESSFTMEVGQSRFVTVTIDPADADEDHRQVWANVSTSDNSSSWDILRINSDDDPLVFSLSAIGEGEVEVNWETPDGHEVTCTVTVVPCSDTTKCGNNLYWAYDQGVLTITGNGDMDAFTEDASAPWATYAEQITTVSLPEGVTSIGDYAFFECTHLTAINLPDGLLSIGKFAFGGCSSFASLSLPASLISIGKQAFSNCASLTDLSIPDAVNSIGDSAFEGCTGLTTVAVGGANTSFLSENGILFNAGKTTLLLYPAQKAGTAYAVPATVTRIGAHAFQGNTSLTSVTLPNGLLSVDNGAFLNCTNLQTAALPYGLKTIGRDAFRNCSSLTGALTIYDTITSVGKYAFADCGLTQITFQGDLQLLDTNAFSNNADLTTVTIRGDIWADPYREEPNDPFSGCSALQTVVVEEGVTRIAEEVFSNIPNLRSITLPSTLKTIGECGFFCCQGLTSVTIPGSVESIGTGAFQSCFDLESVTILEGVTALPDDAFIGCKSLTTVQLPSTLTSIGSSCFSGTAIASIAIPEGVKIIENHTFTECADLTTISLPASLERIEGSAFDYCDKLTLINYAGTKTDRKDISIDWSSQNKLRAATWQFSYTGYENLQSVSEGENTIIVAVMNGVATLPADAFANVVSDNKNVTIEAVAAQVTFDSVAADAIAANAGSTTELDLNLTVTEDQATSKKTLDITLLSGSTNVFADGTEGTAAITVPFANADENTVVNLVVTDENGDEVRYPIPASDITYVAGESVTFTVHHFSTYEVSGSAAEEDTYVVAGSANANNIDEDGIYTAIFGTSWNGSSNNNSSNTMTQQSDGTYKKGYYATQSYSRVELKVVKNGTEWYGYNGGNVQFQITGSGAWNVIFDPSDNSVRVEGSNIFYEGETPADVYIVGNGAASDPSWLNGKTWNTSAAVNKMVRVDAGIYEITFTNISAGEKRFKFALNGSWDENYGGTFGGYGTAFALTADGNDIAFTPNQGDDIKIQFNLAKKTCTVCKRCQVIIDSNIVNGTLSADPSSGWSGDRITLTATPASGYQVNKYIVDGAERTYNYFNLGDHDPTVSATFVTRQYSVTSTTYSTNGVAGDSEGGNVKLSRQHLDYMNRPLQYDAGTEITLEVTNYRGYTLSLIAKDENNQDVPLTAGSSTVGTNGETVTAYTLILPTSDVTVTAEFTGERLYQIKPNPGLYAPGATTYHTMTEAEIQQVVQTMTVSPEYAVAGTTVTVTMVPKTGYYVKHSMESFDTFGNTLTKTGDFTYTFVVPDYYAQHSGTRNINVTTVFASGLDEGYYVQIGDAAQSDWLRMPRDDPFFGFTEGSCPVYSVKTSLTAGQLLTAYYVSNPGATPVQKATLNVTASGTQTIYYVAEGTGELHVSGLNGYYIVHANVTSTRPYGITEDEKLTYRGDGYTYDGLFKGAHWVCVAEYEEGTVVGTYPNVNNVDTRFVTPREDEVGQPYQGTGPECFPYDGAMGRAWFDPNGQGGPDYAGGYLKVRRLYTFEFDWNYDEINHADVVIASSLGDDEYAAGGETISFEIEPIEGYVVSNVTIIKLTDETAVSCEEEAGVYTFTMPADDVLVYINFAESENHIVAVLMIQLAGAANGGYTISPDGAENIEAGTTVKVMFTPYDGYAVDYVTSNVSDKDAPVDVTAALVNNVYTFTMPDWSVVIEVHWKEAEPVDVPVTGITVDPATASLTVGGTQQLTATVEPAGATNPTVTWSSSDTSIATVDENGLVTAVAVGTATITGAAGDQTATCAVTVTAAFTEGYYLVKIPADATNVSLTDTLYWLELARNESATFGEEYMLAGGIDIPLTEGDKLFVIRVQDGAVQVWDNAEETWGTEFSLSKYTYLVDANHEDEHAKVYFREQTPNPETHPFWQDFGGHLFIAIAREIRIIPVSHGTVTASPAMGVYTETITLTVTPDPGYRLKSLEVWYRENEYDRTTITPENGVFTMPDYPVTVEAVFCLEDGFYLLGSMQNWSKDSLTPAEKFVANTNNADEYMLEYTFTAATDAFKVVELKDGEIKDDVWYRTEMDGHTSGEPDFNYVINDQTGFKTVYFRPVWNNDWHGHIWIGDAMSPYFKGHGLALGDAINVRFNLALPGGKDLYEGSYVEFMIENATGTKRYVTADAVQVENDPDNGTPRYRYVCPVNAIQMADMITPVFHYTVDGEERTVQGKQYAAKTYIDNHKNEDEVEYRNAVRATGDYGHFAQLYLHDVHGTDYGTHAEMPLYGTGSYDYDAIYGLLEDLEIVRPLVGDMEKITTLLYCDSQTGIWLYLRLKDGYSGPTPTATYNGNTVEMSPNPTGDGRFCYKIPGSMASELDQMKNVTLTVGADSTVVKVAVLSWVRGSLGSNDASANEKNFASSLYSYWKAAVEYQAAQSRGNIYERED